MNMATSIKNRYVMTEEQIEEFAAERTQSLRMVDGYDSTYLRVLLTGVQAKLGTQKRGKRTATDTQLEAIESVAVPFYAAVLRGVTTQDIELGPELEADEVRKRTTERNRRATFARTAKSTLVQWTMEGGDMRALDVATVTKGELRASIVAARTDRGTTVASRIERAQETILTAAAREGPEMAREHLERVIAVLQAALGELPADTVDHGQSAVIKTPGALFKGHLRTVPARAVA